MKEKITISLDVETAEKLIKIIEIFFMNEESYTKDEINTFEKLYDKLLSIKTKELENV
jgi:hypothetical protein